MIAGLEGNVYFNVLVKFSENRNHSIKSKAFKPRIANERKLRMRDAGQSFGLASRQPALIERAYDFCGKNGACLLDAGVSTPKVTENITAAANESTIVFHCKASLFGSAKPNY
jgi:hypothetical protein